MVAHGNRKAKGHLMEKKVVNELQEAGFAAERIRDQSGRRDDALEGGDITVPLCGVDRTVECKHHKAGFDPCYRALDKASFAVVKGNHKEPLVVTRFSTWLEHIKLAEAIKAENAQLKAEIDRLRARLAGSCRVLPISEAAE